MATIEKYKGYPVNYIKLDWTTPTTAGTITHTTENRINGHVDRVVIVPGTPTPVTAFTVTLTDEDNVDILKGSGAACTASASTDIYPDYKMASDLDMVVGAAGTNRSGYVKIFWSERND